MKQSTMLAGVGETQIEPTVSVKSDLTAKSSPLVRLALLAFVWLLALYQFSETTVDPDLWGHVVFGQQMLRAHAVERTEIYSWTVHGQPFINHEYGADLILGTTHLLLGGTGILLLKIVIGFLTFGLALRLGTQGGAWPSPAAAMSSSWPESAIALAIGALAVTEISFGFAARPQIFTALGIVIELLLLRRIHDGKYLWAIALPLLFAIWINIHGGALAGAGLLGLAAGSTTLQFLWSSRKSIRETLPRIELRTLIALWLAALGVFAALCCNPWGPALVRWLVQSVLWLRPEIEEWNPTPFGWDHAALFILIAISAFAWLATRRKRALWELAVCGAFAVLALRSVRNTPLFAIIALALVPPHLADVLARFRTHFDGLIQLWRQPRIQTLLSGLLGIISCTIAVSTFTLHKDHPLTMEVPRSSYPVAAIDFIRAHHLRGNVFSFFDWGDMIIFQLPDCSPSIDGRLDACYPRSLIKAHWNLYNAEPVDEAVFQIDHADLALLPSKLAGTLALRNRPGWRVVYFDETAAILARDVQRFPGLTGVNMPVQGTKEVSLGRTPFPNASPRSK